VLELSTRSGNAWVRVAIPGSNPPRSLKIAGEEYAHNLICKWRSWLTGGDRLFAERIREVLADDNETKADWLARALPPAPEFPL
jgi:hypothetical protein